MLGRASVGGVDGDTAGHILHCETARAVTSHHAAGMFVGSVDRACRAQVLDGGTVGVAEGTAEFGIGGIVEGKGVAVAVESTFKCMVSVRVRMIAHPAADADVLSHLEVLSVVALA